MEGSKIGMHALDYVIFAVILIVSIGIGLFYAFRGRGQQTTNEFLMGSRKLSTIPVAISIFASIVSGISFIGHPVEMYTRGTQFSVSGLGMMGANAVIAFTFVPLFFELRVMSAFEYLEARYQSKYVKLYGSIITLVKMVLMSGITLYGPAVVLQAINGFPIWLSILIISGVTIVYTVLGGMKAVIYTDVFQSFCMVAGMIAIVIQGTREVGSLGRVWELSEKGERIQFFNMDPNPTLRTSFWINTIGFFFSSLEVNQTTIQRVCSLPTLTKAKRSVLLNVVFFLFYKILITTAGLVIYAYYADLKCDPLQAKYITSQNQLVPYFITDALNYPGLSGALFAALAGGALSTVSSNLNSATTIAWQDILKYKFEHLSEYKKTMVTKILTLVFGIISTIFAFAAQYMTSHVYQVLITVAGILGGPMLGLFLLGVLFPFVNSKGAMTGSLTATAFSTWIAVGSMFYNLHAETLPTTIENCNLTLTDPESSPLNFSFSYEKNELLNPSTQKEVRDPLEMFFNWTLPPSSERNNDIMRMNSNDNILIPLYSISCYLFACIGAINTIIIGVIISLLTGGLNQPKPHPSLMIPIFDRLCCCLPEQFRRHFRCGIEYKDDDKGQNEDTLVTDGLFDAGGETMKGQNAPHATRRISKMPSKL